MAGHGLPQRVIMQPHSVFPYFRHEQTEQTPSTEEDHEIRLNAPEKATVSGF